ncbi:unnamed protein product, partial [Allacma fusca]
GCLKNGICKVGVTVKIDPGGKISLRFFIQITRFFRTFPFCSWDLTLSSRLEIAGESSSKRQILTYRQEPSLCLVLGSGFGESSTCLQWGWLLMKSHCAGSPPRNTNESNIG